MPFFFVACFFLAFPGNPPRINQPSHYQAGCSAMTQKSSFVGICSEVKSANAVDIAVLGPYLHCLYELSSMMPVFVGQL